MYRSCSDPILAQSETGASMGCLTIATTGAPLPRRMPVQNGRLDPRSTRKYPAKFSEPARNSDPFAGRPKLSREVPGAAGSFAVAARIRPQESVRPGFPNPCASPPTRHGSPVIGAFPAHALARRAISTMFGIGGPVQGNTNARLPPAGRFCVPVSVDRDARSGALPRMCFQFHTRPHAVRETGSAAVTRDEGCHVPTMTICGHMERAIPGPGKPTEQARAELRTRARVDDMAVELCLEGKQAV